MVIRSRRSAIRAGFVGSGRASADAPAGWGSARVPDTAAVRGGAGIGADDRWAAAERRRLVEAARGAPPDPERIEVVLGTGAVEAAGVPGLPPVEIDEAPLATRAPEVRVHAPAPVATAIARGLLAGVVRRYGSGATRARIDREGLVGAVWRADVRVAGVAMPLRVEACGAGRCGPGVAVLPGVADLWVGPDGTACAREAGRAGGRWVPVEPSWEAAP